MQSKITYSTKSIEVACANVNCQSRICMPSFLSVLIVKVGMLPLVSSTCHHDLPTVMDFCYC